MTEVIVAPDHKARKHAKISPSKLNYLDPAVGGCCGYLGSDETTKAAEEGTTDHERMDVEMKEWIQGGMHGSLEGHLFVRRLAIKWSDDEDYRYRFCARAIDRFLKGHPEVLLERRVSVFDPVGVEITWGHYDVLIVIGKKIGILVDWKFGIVPIVPADQNRQGFAYAVGVLQERPEIDKLAVMFVQPKLNWVTSHVILRTQLDRYVGIVKEIVDGANAAARSMESSDPSTILNAGLACRYCTRCADCPAYVKQLALAAPATGALPVPKGLQIDLIDTPEKAAVAVAWVDFLSEKLPDIRKKALEIADRNGGSIAVTTDDGTSLIYDVKERGFDRSLGETGLVMDAVKDWVAPEELLAVAKLSYGSVEDLVATKMADQQDITKKAAKEALSDHLTSQGLLSRPDGKIRFLTLRKEKKEPKTKQLKNKE